MQVDDIFDAIVYWDTDALKAFLDSGVDVDVADELGETALHASVRHLCFDAVKLLLAAGADVNKPTVINESTPLDAAIRVGSYGMVELLVDHGADASGVNLAVEIPKWMNFAADTLRLLLSHGARMDCVDKHGDNLFWVCLLNSHFKCCTVLFEYGADINEVDSLGRTPLMYAVQYQELDVFEFLLKNGADVNRCDDKRGSTALHRAVLAGSECMSYDLLEYGACMYTPNANGITAYTFACQYCGLNLWWKRLFDSAVVSRYADGLETLLVGMRVGGKRLGETADEQERDGNDAQDGGRVVVQESDGDDEGEDVAVDVDEDDVVVQEPNGNDEDDVVEQQGGGDGDGEEQVGGGGGDDAVEQDGGGDGEEQEGVVESALYRFGRSALFDANVLSMVSEFVTGVGSRGFVRRRAE